MELVKETHKILTGGTDDERRYIENEERPGEFKKHDYVPGVHEVGSSAENVESELRDLISEVNEYGGGKDVLKASTYLNARFENIHPFADGNGRVGRALMNYYLMIHNHPPLIVYDEDKRMYFECLQKYDEDDEDFVFEPDYLPQEPYRREEPKIGRNDPCPCGSGKKYKKCCGK